MGESMTFPAQFRQCSLEQLLGRVLEGDRQALEEFISQRTVFEMTYTFAEFLRELRRRTLPAWSDVGVVDAAIDSLVDKFSVLGDNAAKDCRQYYRMILDSVQGSALEKELQLAHVLTRYVRRHFSYGLKEAARSGEWTRYEWGVNGGSLQVLLPRTLSGSQRRQWLVSNIGEADASAPGERSRIQSLINEKLGESSFYDESRVTEMAMGQSPVSPRDAIERLNPTQLRDALIDEKCDAIDAQRPAIRSLGLKGLGNLIADIFEGISQGDYRDAEIASRHSIDPATFSRFAGTRWRTKENATVPDLWRNFAQLLAREPLLAEACERAGVWARVATVTSGRSV